MDPRHFDEEFMEEHDLDGHVIDIHGAYHHINTLNGDVTFKRADNFIEGVGDYEAKVSLVTTDYDSLDETHPLQGDEVICLCFGQQYQRDAVQQDGESTTTEEFADGLGYLTPDQARELAGELEEYADEVEETNSEENDEE